MKQDNVIELTEVLKPYIEECLWVALDDTLTNVCGSGKTILEAIQECKNKGVSKPFIIKAQKNFSGFAPTLF